MEYGGPFIVSSIRTGTTMQPVYVPYFHRRAVGIDGATGQYPLHSAQFPHQYNNLFSSKNPI